MPSVLLGQALASGAQILVSGNPWSGGPPLPRGGIQLKYSKQASGLCYIGLSGGMRMNSGGAFANHLSGLLDGMEMGPGDSYWIPRSAFPTSGTFGVYAWTEATASGQGRMFYEIF